MEFKTINKYLENLVNALREENEANTEMLDNFYTYLETDDKKYLKLANNQLREILKGAGFGILLVLPFSPITIPYLLKRAQKLGIDIIPAWYKKLDLNDEEIIKSFGSIERFKEIISHQEKQNFSGLEPQGEKPSW